MLLSKIFTIYATIAFETVAWILELTWSLINPIWKYLQIEQRARTLALKLLKLGPIPRHVAFVMDGNRRYAKDKKKTTGEGHREGFGRLQETLDWCLQLGVSTVTVYAFSVENFRRSQEEVNTLMSLAIEKFEEFATKSDLIAKHGIRVRVIGETHMLPEKLQEAAARATQITRQNSNATLNICFPYTSRHEITSAVRRLVEAVEDGRIAPTDITAEMIERCLGTGDDEELDLLVRTSGEIRLSDFLLWQCSTSCHIHFAAKFWPEFTFWDMFLPILAYQVRYKDIVEARTRRRDELNYVFPPGPLNFDHVALAAEEPTIQRQNHYKVAQVLAEISADHPMS
ncbi:hypothetical protein SmJEL517_g01512 [Synchytrium microbalum]|uniref:Alkyl transferase n=1 Tax=Synchytrium microbalum TaxID=1806994 RepID=A0A507CAY0_9FUNG|nr:uncharacterized protein SmJEL517_g01512 [Synchytrium microbalum]TPX36339.1 hypothetical protein SmJEL517_g01512 [Synchytrium microbalum]